MAAGDFDTFWNRLQKELRRGQRIPTWSILGGYQGGYFDIQYVLPQEVCVVVRPDDRPGSYRIDKSSFQLVHRYWRTYLLGRVQRQELTAASRSTTYTLGIMRHLCSEDVKSMWMDTRFGSL